MSELENITPEESVVPIFLDPTPLPPTDDLPDPLEEIAMREALRIAAIEKLMTEFGFTEEMARAVIGN